MIYTLFTDPHLGTRRAAHTTRDSSKKLTEALYQQALHIATEQENALCMGDLFDKAFNDESTLVQGYNVAGLCRATLAGNHDSTNRADTITSLDALKDMGTRIVSAPDLSLPYYDTSLAHDGIYFVPHHASQELFETAMFHAAAHAAEHRDGLASFLMLHCNYDCGFATEDDTLNLSPEVAERLTNAFDLILLGHEHQPNTYLDGRVVIMGNTHPTSFSDISDKFVYHLEAETAELTKTCIWSKAASYAELTLGAELPDLSEVQFVNVVGMAQADGALEVAEYIQSIWKAGPELFAVRNNVHIGDHLAGTSLEDSRPALVDLKTKIAEDLTGSDLLPLYQKLLQELSV
jgi:DNA repair exonuclease SbcCD nuclease subunit